jgi:hypothetical protein
MIVDVIATVIDTVIVAVHLHGNDTVILRPRQRQPLSAMR